MLSELSKTRAPPIIERFHKARLSWRAIQSFSVAGASAPKEDAHDGQNYSIQQGQ